MIKRYFSRFPHAVRGIVRATKSDFGFRTQIYLGIIVFVVIGYLWRPMSDIEILFLSLAWALILITELQNSAIETALNQLHPELHKEIGHSKDLAAGAVLIAGVFLIIVLVTIW